MAKMKEIYRQNIHELRGWVDTLVWLKGKYPDDQEIDLKINEMVKKINHYYRLLPKKERSVKW